VRATGGSVGEDDLQARVDGRLAPERAAMVETYLTEHPEERERLSHYSEQRGALRAAFGRQSEWPTPKRLRIANLLTVRQHRRRQRLARIAAAVALLFLGGVSGWTAREVLPSFTSSASATLATTVFDGAIAAYRTFSVETRHPVEVGANEETHLVQWLSKRLGRHLIAPDLSSLGFQLMGGRLLPADGGPAAMFMYENGKGTRLSCYFLSVDSGQTEFKYREEKGIGAFYWVEEGLAYAVTANTDRASLLKVAEIIYQQNSPDGAKAKVPPPPGKPS
jgi:anti-sigma factor RsiW